MRNFLKKIFGQDWYCRMFHNGTEIDEHTWRCSKCCAVVKKSKLDKYFLKN